MNRARTRFAALVLGLAIAAAPAAAEGPLYRWVDGRGVIHFTDVPSHAGFLPLVQVAAPRWRPRAVRRYDTLIAHHAAVHAVPPALVKAVIAAESDFNPRAVSRVGAQGLMQLMPATARALGVTDPFRTDENVDAGTRYLRSLLSRYGDWDRALAAYNAGPKAVDRYRAVPPYPETRQYVERVLAYYRQYDADFPR